MDPVAGQSCRAAIAALCLCLSSQAPAFAAPAIPAFELDLPVGAHATAGKRSRLGSVDLPTGPWADGQLPVRRIEGQTSRRAWRLDGSGITTLQLLAPLRAQIVAAGYDVLLDCDAAECGGFDFRFAISVLPAPDMYVNLGDYPFLSAVSPDGDAAVSVLVSRSSSASFVQISRVLPQGAPQPRVSTSGAVPVPEVALPLAEALERTGHAVLEGLTFDSGSARLGPGQFASLASLAAWLKADPKRVVAVVGHTDTTGALAGNIVLSKKRARSVAARLKDDYDVPARQIDAEGMGYLAPRASNLDQAGREANRRVEAVLISDG